MRTWLGATCAGLIVLTGIAHAWWVGGHEQITEAAAASLPEDVPAFFRNGGKALAHYSGEPDRWKNRTATYLKAAESPNHFIDLEDYGDEELPGDRYKAGRLLGRRRKSAERAGLLPYAIMENYDRLSCAFYDLRNEKDKMLIPVIQAKCLVYAGILAHYTGDLAMPLHTTVDYDGRRESGKFVQKGIHAKIDAFPEKHGVTAREIMQGLKAKKLDDVWEHVVKAINESHTHIDRCYELDKGGAFETPTKESRELILARCRAGAQLTMDLWYSAWLRSADMPAHY